MKLNIEILMKNLKLSFESQFCCIHKKLAAFFPYHQDSNPRTFKQILNGSAIYNTKYGTQHKCVLYFLDIIRLFFITS